MLNVRLAKGDMFYAFNTDGTKIMELNLETLEKNIFDSNINGIYWRTFAKSFDNDEKWLVPLEGTEIIKYNLKEKKGQKYNLSVPGLEGYDRALGKKSMMRLFSTGTFDGDRVIISPWWGNKFIELDCVTEKVNEWESPFECSEENKSIYIPNYGIGYFMQDEKDGRSLYCHEVEKKYFYVDLKTKEIQEYPQEFMGKERIKDSLRKGYVKRDGEIGYYFIESMYNSLLDNINEDEVDNNIFDAEKQKEEFIRINQSMDGNCGRTVLEKIK